MELHRLICQYASGCEDWDELHVEWFDESRLKTKEQQMQHMKQWQHSL